MKALYLVAALMVLGAANGVAQAMNEDQARFRVEAELWIDGQQMGTPTLLVSANAVGSIEVGDADDAWRLEVLVEPVADGYAPADTLWIHVDVQEQVSGQWETLADSLLGVPEGETATFSVVEGETAATAESALVYLLISARPEGQGD